MKFTTSHDFPGISLSQYEKLYFDEEFQIALCASVNLTRTVLRLDRDGAKLVRHVRIEPSRELPGPVAKILGGKKFSYVEELEYVMGSNRGTWKVLPNIMTEKVDAHGTLEFDAIWGGGVKRTVTGDISVGIFGIGGIVERFVVSDVEKSYGDAAVFTREYIAKHPELAAG